MEIWEEGTALGPGTQLGPALEDAAVGPWEQGHQGPNPVKEGEAAVGLLTGIFIHHLAMGGDGNGLCRWSACSDRWPTEMGTPGMLQMHGYCFIHCLTERVPGPRDSHGHDDGDGWSADGPDRRTGPRPDSPQ